MRKFKLTSLFIATSLAFSNPLWADDHAKEADAEEKTEEKKEKSFAEKLEEKKEYAGLLNIYRDEEDGSGMVVITDDMLDKPYLHMAKTVNGVLDAGHFKGAYRGGKLIKFRKYFNRIDVVAVNPRFYFDESNAISRSADSNISDAVLISAEIKMHEDGKYAIDLGELFLNENIHKVSPFPNPNDTNANRRFKLGKFEKSKSRITEINNFPANSHVVVDYVFADGNPKVRGGNEITDPRYVSVQLQHAIVELPENGFEPRRDDPRVGYFHQQFDDLTSDDTANYRDVINRWNLEKKDPTAAVSDPVKPITWWIENTTPMEWRETIREATLAWNTSFEKAGISNAIEVKVQPDDAEWTADDVRYNVLRWTSSPRPPFGGYGPSIANPYTGEIIAADIMLEYTFMKGRWILANFLTEGYSEADMQEFFLEDNHMLCSLGHSLNANLIFGQTAALTAGMGDIEKDEMLRQSMYYLILHEVGHTLGLNHNMKATQLHGNDVVHDKSVTQGILAGSVMDYPSVNFAPPGKEQGDFYTEKPGPYDDWVIEYGYSAALDDAEAEEKRLEAILSRSADPALAFGNDAEDMRAPGRHIDPTINIFDMSGDAIAYAADRVSLIQEMLTKMPEKALVDGENYNNMLVGVSAVFNEYARQMNVVSRYVGGVYTDRSYVGQPGATKPFTPVDVETQKQAMAVLTEHAFAPGAFDNMQPLYSLLQRQRRGFNGFGNNEDPKIHDMVLRMQQGVLAHVLHPNVTKRITDTSLYGNGYSLEAMMSDLTDAIFAADMKSNVSSFRRNIQVAYVNSLIGAAGLEKASKHDSFTQAVATYELSELQKQLSSKRGNQATKVHRAFLLDRINRAFHKSKA